MTQRHSFHPPSNRLNHVVLQGAKAGIQALQIDAMTFTDHATTLFNAELDWIYAPWAVDL